LGFKTTYLVSLDYNATNKSSFSVQRVTNYRYERKFGYIIMAEAHERQQLSPEEQRVFDEFNRYEEDVHRGVPAVDTADMFQPDMQRKTFQKSAPSDGPRVVKACPQRKQEDVGLMNLELQVNQSAEATWEQVVNMFTRLQNCDPMVETYSMMGNYYVRGTFCEFLVGMFQVDGSKKVLDFKRMSGSGFVLDSFFRTSKEGLQADGLINKEDEDDDGDAVWDDGVYSDGSDDEGMDTYGFLQFSYDPSLVTSWIEKIKVRHVEDKNHIMGLLAYNANNDKNLEIIVREGGTNLRDMCLLQFEESNSAALVRNTAALVAKVTTVPEAKNHGYDADFVTTVMYTIVDWCPKPHVRKLNGRSNFEISESRETVMFLLEFLENVKEWVGEDVILEKASALKPEDRAMINNFLQKRADSVNFAMKLFPEKSK